MRISLMEISILWTWDKIIKYFELGCFLLSSVIVVPKFRCLKKKLIPLVV